MKEYAVFYAGQVCAEFDRFTELKNYTRSLAGEEIYNGGYIYSAPNTPNWYRMDLTPVRLDDVPKELRLMVLLLT